LNGILWIDRTGAPWRDLPRRYGPVGTASSRFYVSGAFGPFSGPLDDQPLFAAAQCQGISSSMRLWGQPLTRRVSTSLK
jgi:transposase